LSGPPFAGGVIQMGNINIGSGIVLVHRPLSAAALVGTLNSVPVADIAQNAVVLETGGIAFIGDPSQQVATSFPTWLGPGIMNVGGHLHGAGVIDASPVYSFPHQSGGEIQTAATSNVGGVPSAARLSEFNRLPEAPGLWSFVQREQDDQAIGISAASNTVVQPTASAPARQVLRFAQQESATTTTTRGATPSTRGTRYCTVAELRRGAKGCR
jgi:hypothetical protein